MLPRVRKLITEWPQATTTDAFIQHLDDHDIAALLGWTPGTKKLLTLRGIADTLQTEGVQTVDQLLERLTDPEFRATLRQGRGVGPKTVDYLSILCGGEARAAIDVHVKAFICAAGVSVETYEDAQALIAEAAKQRGWTPGALDAVIWAHQSER